MECKNAHQTFVVVVSGNCCKINKAPHQEMERLEFAALKGEQQAARNG